MRAAPSAVAFRLIVGLSAAGVAATLGCSGRPGSDVVVASAAASAAPAEQERREKGEEASCCARHFPGNRRLREACLSDAAHHHGVCAPKCPPPHDAGAAPDAGRVDAGANHDAAPPDARVPKDAAAPDASVTPDAARIDAGSDASDSGAPVICPTNILITDSEFTDDLSHHDRFTLNAQTSAGETVTWSASGTPGISFFVFAGSDPPIASIDCGAEGSIDVTATIVGPGSCVLTETTHVTCAASCGNGIVDPGEQCDPPNGVTCDKKCQLGPAPTCGDGILEPGEGCDVVSSTWCKLCEVTNCGQCVTANLGKYEICSSTDGTQKIACQALEQCMFYSFRGLCSVVGTPTFGCFCTDATCSTGPSGPCGRELQAYLGTTDQDALVAAANSAQMTQLITAMNGAYPCLSYCSLHPYP